MAATEAESVPEPPSESEAPAESTAIGPEPAETNNTVAPVQPESPAPAPSGGVASLEEELLGEEPAAREERLSEAVVKARLAKVGRLLAAW